MKITDIKVYITNPSIENWMFVEIVTDSGIVGTGEISSSPQIEKLVASQVLIISKKLIGKDPLDIKSCNSDINTWSFPYYGNNIIFSTVYSGIDQALWDIYTQYKRIPLYKAIGGVSDIVPVYANINRALRKDHNIDHLINNCKNAVFDGFKKIKIAPFVSLTPDCESMNIIKSEISNAIIRIKTISQYISYSNLSIDCHQKFNLISARVLLEELQKENITLEYIEDLFDYSIYSNYQLLKLKSEFNNNFVIGETCTSWEQFKGFEQNGDYYIYNPDVKFIGGISGGLKVVKYLISRQKHIRLHNPTSPVSTAYSAALSSIIPNTYLEFAYGEENVRSKLLDCSENIHDGIYYLSKEPGAGVSISEEFRKEYCFQYTI